MVALSDPYLSLVAGGIAGAMSRTAVSPMERVKVLFQVQSSQQQAYQSGTLRTIYQIYLDEGVKGLFRGNGVNCIRIVPYTAIQYTVYESLKKALTHSERDLSAMEKVYCGFVGGISSVAGTYPLDLVKTRLSVLTASALTSADKGAKLDLSLWGNLRDIYQNEGGLRALYRGFIPTSMGVAPYVSLNFTFFELFNESLIPQDYRSTSVANFVCGGLSGGVSQTIVYPFDILRRRFQVATMKHSSKMSHDTNGGVYGALKGIVKRDGVLGLYKGWGANMWKIIPSMAVQWWAFGKFRSLLGP